MEPDAAEGDVKRPFSSDGEGQVSLQAGHPLAEAKPRQRSRRKTTAESEEESAKRRCVSTACVACRKRKSKCDGNTPACAACSQVYNTECIYDPNSDHRRKGVYKNDIDNLKTRNSTLQTLIQAILNYPEDEVPALVRDIRTCESLDAVADRIVAKENGVDVDEEEEHMSPGMENGVAQHRTFETQLYGKMGDLRLDDGCVRYIGGTSNLIHLAQDDAVADVDEYHQQEDPITSWTDVTDDPELVVHLLNMYFTFHYTFFTTLSKNLFYRDFLLGKPPDTTRRKTHYCTPLLCNAILALGCHFTSHSGARANPADSATAGDHFFREAKRLIMANDEHEKPRLTTIQALALMSVREAGCGREAAGFAYSGMAFRMACDMGLNLDSGRLTTNKHVNGDEAEEDVRRITFWGCFLFDKCWSNYLGRLPQIPTSIVTVPKFEVFPDEDAAQWSPYSDSGFSQAHAQASRTRAVSLQIVKLCEISSDLMRHFYNPTDMEKTKGKAAELKKLSEIHTRLEGWRRDLPKEMEPREGGLSSVLVMHMFFQLLFIHLFRPFLKYTQATSPLPQNVSPRKLCTQAAAMISKLLRLYKRSYGLRQICNIAVYIAHSACTIHLLNLPEKNARRDIVHGVKHLEEIAEGWLCARRTLGLLSVLARKWNVELPDEAAAVLARTDSKYGRYLAELNSPKSERRASEHPSPVQHHQFAAQPTWPNPAAMPSNFSSNNAMPTMATHPVRIALSGSAGPTSVRNTTPTYSLPPQDANGLRAQQYPSAAATPASVAAAAANNNSRQRSRDSLGDRSAASPSDMFGGVEQLIRDSQDWVYRDQAQFATGFENWNAPLELDPVTWTNGGAGAGAFVDAGGVNAHTGVNGAMPKAGMMAGNMQQQQPGLAPAPFGPMNMTNGGAVGGGGYMMTDWLDGMTSYNEDEWYQ